jgi:nicotinamidase-related amidase
MQNDFCSEDGAAARLGQDIEPVRAIVENVVTLIEGARKAEIPRVFVRVEHDRFFDTPAWLARGRAGTTLDGDQIPVVEKGSWERSSMKASHRATTSWS